jgi:WD40-like Beta Propeller Repeat
MAYANPTKSMSRKQGWPRILVATVAIVVLGWAGIGLDPASLNLDGWRWIVEADSPRPRLVRVFDHDGEIGDIAWSPDGRKIAAGGELHRALMIWEVATGALLHNLNREDGSVSAVAWSRDGRYVAAGRWFTLSTRSHVAINVWDAQTGRRLQNLQGPSPVAQGANDVTSGALRFSPDGTLLAAGHRGVVSIHEVASGRLVSAARANMSIGRVVAFSPDGTRIVTSGEYRTSPIQVFEATTGAHLRSFTGDPEPPVALSYRPDGTEIATADYKRPIVTIWDVENGRPSRALSGHSRPVRALTYGIGGRLLVSAAPAGGVIVWNAASGERLTTLPNPSDLTYAIALSPDDRFVAAPVGRQVRIWDISAVHSNRK